MKNMHFTIQSPENMTRLLATILFEKTEHLEDYGHLWFETFNIDDNNGDNLFYQFLVELFPQGVTIGTEEVNLVMEHALKYLQTNKECQDKQIEYLKQKHSSWVYSKWNNRLYPCGFAKHTKTIIKCCLEFFDGEDIEQYDQEAIRRFILSNFEIRSANSTLSQIANDNIFYLYTELNFKKMEIYEKDGDA